MKARFFLWVIACDIACAVNAAAADPLESKQRPSPAPREPVSQTDRRREPASAETEVVTKTASTSQVVKSVAQDEINRLIDKGYQQIDVGNVKEAIQLFRKVLARDPANKQARFGLGTAFIQLQQYKEALAIMEPMAMEFPKDYLLKNNIAWLYATAKDVSIRNGAKAIRFAQDALLIAPKDFHVWSTLSESYFVSGKYDRALRAAEEALKLSLESSADADSVNEYRQQVEKNRKASQAMSVLK